MVENDHANIYDFQIQIDQMVVANQPSIVMVDKCQKKEVVIDVAIQSR